MRWSWTQLHHLTSHRRLPILRNRRQKQDHLPSDQLAGPRPPCTVKTHVQAHTLLTRYFKLLLKLCLSMILARYCLVSKSTGDLEAAHSENRRPNREKGINSNEHLFERREMHWTANLDIKEQLSSEATASTSQGRHHTTGENKWGHVVNRRTPLSHQEVGRVPAMRKRAVGVRWVPMSIATVLPPMEDNFINRVWMNEVLITKHYEKFSKC